MAYTLTNLQDDIRNYTEVDSSVLSTAVLNTIIKNAPDRVQMLKMLYEDELQRALQEDGSSSSTYISPKVYYPES